MTPANLPQPLLYGTDRNPKPPATPPSPPSLGPPADQAAFDFHRPAEHDLRILADDETAALRVIGEAMRLQNARLVKLSATVQQDGVCFSLRLRAPDAEAARAVTAAIAADAGVLSAHVEHIWWRSRT